MTWPEIVRLLKKMEEYPPIDFLAAGFLQSHKPKPLAAQGLGGVPVRKGKVMKRGDISR